MSLIENFELSILIWKISGKIYNLIFRNVIDSGSVFKIFAFWSLAFGIVFFFEAGLTVSLTYCLIRIVRVAF